MDELQFGRYRLVELIAEGGMGKVYKAHDSMLRRDVAIKILRAEFAAEDGYRERFQREAYTVAALTEPHIIPIHDYGEIDERLFLVMPIIKGIDVQTLLQRGGAMSPERAVLWSSSLPPRLMPRTKRGWCTATSSHPTH